MKRLSEEWWATRSVEIRARRCHAHRRNGAQCTKVALAGQQICGTHGGFAPQNKSKARKRLEEAADRMAARLLGFAESEGVPAYVALAATQDALDRAGLKPPSQVEVGIAKPYEELLNSVGGVAQISRADSRAARGLPDDRAEIPGRPPSADADEPLEVVDAELVDMGETHPDSAPAARSPFVEGDAPIVPPAAGRGLQTMEDAVAELAQLQRRAPRR